MRANFLGLFLGLIAWKIYLIVQLLPKKLGYWLILTLAQGIYIFWGGGRKRLLTNLALVRPDFEPELHQHAAQLRRAMARTWSFLLGRGKVNLEELRERIEGAEPLLARYHAGEKLVVTAVHVGPVNELVPAVAALGVEIFAPAEAIPPLLYGLMARLRMRFGGIGFDRVEKGETLKRCAAALNKGRIVAFMVDMDREEERGVLCRIGGACAYFPVGAVKLALEQGATIIPVFPYYDQDWVPHLRVGEPFELYPTGNSATDIELNLRRLVEEVFAPHIERYCDTWWRHFWAKLRPVERASSS